MKHETRGRKPDLERRQLILCLRAQGLTLQAIGTRLGVSREAVRQQLSACGRRGRLPRQARH